MKRANNLLLEIADPDNLRLAFYKAAKGKRYSNQVMKYQGNLEGNLVALYDQILSQDINVGQYNSFKIFDPKERLISAPSFPEQVLHHAIMNICHEYFERKLIYDTYACREGKGTYAALDRTRKFIKRYKWFLKLDVRKFFTSIHHEVLKNQMSRLFKDYQLIEILNKIIDSYEDSTRRGLPIGNLTSQYFANHYLSDLDHFIKEILCCKAYVRYMDDMVLWSDDKEYLKAAFCEIVQYVEQKLKCELKPMVLNKSKLGLSFLGYRTFPFYVRLTQQSKKRFIRKMALIENNYHSGIWEEKYCQVKVLPLLAFVQHADSTRLIKDILY